MNDFIDDLATHIVGPAPAVRLLITIGISYPLGVIHRIFLYRSQPYLQHLYFTVTGLTLGYFNYGIEIGHCLFTVLTSCAILKLFNGNKTALQLNSIFNVSYLMTGYYFTETGNYELIWTLPQCILTLRMIGLGFDCYDSLHAPKESLGNDQNLCAVNEVPSFLETLGFVFFPAAFLTGPFYPINRYLKFVNDTFESTAFKDRSGSVTYAITRLLLGSFYLTVFLGSGEIINNESILTENFHSLPLFYRIVLIGIWGRCVLYKYVSFWLLAEGACALFGITYNGVDANGKLLWNGLESSHLSQLNYAWKFNDYVKSFNLTTNQWLAFYVYKRCKFLGNRYASQLIALFCLAAWHGLQTGYYLAFLLEFVMVFIERDLEKILTNYPNVSKWAEWQIVRIFIGFWTFVLFGFSLLPFVLLKKEKYLIAFSNVNNFGFWIITPYLFLIKPLLMGISYSTS